MQTGEVSSGRLVEQSAQRLPGCQGPSQAASAGAQVEASAEEITRLRLAVRRLARRIGQQASVGLTSSQLSALFNIRRLEPVSLGVLAAAEGLRPPSLTPTVVALEQAGLVERLASGPDRRVSRVILTAAGRRTLGRARKQRSVWLAEQLARLDPQQVRAVLAALPALESLSELP